MVVLTAWRFFWPSSFTRWIAGPARGKWRGWWCYRRRWAGVMAISGVAPWHQGRIVLPVLGKVSATRYTDRVAVRLVSGQSPADLARCAENLAHGFGAMLCRVRTARSGRVVLEFVRRDALAAIVPALPIPAHPDLTALPVGRREDGLAWLVRLHGTHLLIAGATGAGKASLLWGLIRAMFPLMQAGLVRVLAADPKLMELAFGRVIFERYGAYAADPEAIAVMLEQAVADMQERAARFAGKRRDHTPTAEDPFVVVLVDEVAFLTAYQRDRKLTRADHGRPRHPHDPGPGGRVLRGGRAAGPAQGRAGHPEPVPGPDRDAAGRARSRRTWCSATAPAIAARPAS